MFLSRLFDVPVPRSRREHLSRRKLALAATISLCMIFPMTACAPSQDDMASRGPELAGETLALRWASGLAIEDPSDRTASLALLVANVDSEDGPALESIAMNIFRHHRTIDDLILMDAWTRADPVRAASYAMQAGSAHGEVIREAVVRRWASIDPPAAVAGIGVQDRFVERAIVSGWSESGQPGLEDYVLSAGASNLGQTRIAGYAEELRRAGGAQALVEWIDSVRGRAGIDPMVVLHVHRKGMVELVIADPERALAFCDLHCDEPYAQVARVRVADRMGLIGEGRKALDWLAASSGAPVAERQQGARVALRGYMRSDFDGALEWAEQALPKYGGQAWFDSLAQLTLNVFIRRQPEKAIPWLDAIDESLREPAAIRIGRRWRELDEPAAEAWLQTTSLGPEALAAARAPAGNAPVNTSANTPVNTPVNTPANTSDSAAADPAANDDARNDSPDKGGGRPDA